MPIHVSETMPGDELIVTTKNETLACKVIAVTPRQEPEYCCFEMDRQINKGIFILRSPVERYVLYGRYPDPIACLRTEPIPVEMMAMDYCPFCGAKLKE